MQWMYFAELHRQRAVQLQRVARTASELRPARRRRPAPSLTPPAGSGAQYLRWLSRRLRPEAGWATATGVIWMAAQAVIPAVIGAAIDQGVAGGSTGRLLDWSLVLLLIAAVQGVVGSVRHKYAVTMRLSSTYWTTELIGAHAARLGAGLPRAASRGELTTVATTDIAAIGSMFEAWAQVTGSITAFAVVAAVLLLSSVPLGLVVLAGSGVLTLVIGPMLKPLQRRNATVRQLQAELNGTATDIVAGLRVLRGVGGEEVVEQAYRDQSQRVRVAGVQAARVQSLLNAAQVLLPGAFVVLIVWLGARFAAHRTISPGDLVAFYGYAAFLVLPLRTITAFSGRVIQARIGADHVARFLRTAPAPAAAVPPPGRALVEPRSGLAPRVGAFTVVVDADPGLGDRLAGLEPGDVTLGGARLDGLDRGAMHAALLLHDATGVLFSGALRDQLDPAGRHTDAELRAALEAASAGDILDGLDGGLAAILTARGANLSGGQRQRLLLARALLADPDVLVLVEPTSAVDAHTEARIAARLPGYRRGRTTVVLTASPTLRGVADDVVELGAEREVA